VREMLFVLLYAAIFLETNPQMASQMLCGVGLKEKEKVDWRCGCVGIGSRYRCQI
jgi:hypothetical protein